jgi:hypothetical protein
MQPSSTSASSRGALTIGSWPVASSTTRTPPPPIQAPLQFAPERVASVPRTFVDCIQPRLGTIDSIRPRVRDANFWGGAWVGGGGVRVVELATGHDPMVSAPRELTEILLGCA